MKINSSGIEFEFMNCSAAQIINRYHVGKIKDDSFNLEPYELLFLYLKGKIKPVQEIPEQEIINLLSGKNLFNFYIYLTLKRRGFIIMMENNIFFFKRIHEAEYKRLVLIKENEMVDFLRIFSYVPSYIVTLDEEGGLTYFYASTYDPEGSVALPDGHEIPSWFGSTIIGIRHFNSFENNYLSKIIESAYDVLYQDLVSRNFIVKSGFKYGQNFRIYQHSMEDHAEFLVSLMNREYWYKISRSIRLSSSVRKKTLIAGFANNKLEYIIIERLKDI
ncbi:MAG: hypothetical protein QXZ44_04755 [Ferroplasma sp.]